MGRRNLLLCFDAFGTLFHPKRPVPEQYAAVARQCGLDGITAQQVQVSFKAAFSEESRAHPNYGKATGMGAEKWWTNVIHKTFQPLAGPERALPNNLAPKLLHRFTSDEGYALSPGVASLLRQLKRVPRQDTKIMVGVITNSDDRAPSILSSLGLRVSPARFGTPFSFAEVAGQHYDIDLHCMSYDVGFAKPDRRIFDAAEDMANQLAAAQDGDARSDMTVPWVKVYVGDDFKSDVVGARGAGWSPVYVGAEEGLCDQEVFSNLDSLETQTVEEALTPGNRPVTIRAGSTQSLLEWLIQRYTGPR